MKFRRIAAVLFTAFGLGRTFRAIAEQENSTKLVLSASASVHLVREKTESAVFEATDEAAGF